MESYPRAAARESALAPEQWEARLVGHYLRSDGPQGGASLTCLDATPSEIATASGIPGINESEAQAIFLAHFDRGSVRRWLSGDLHPPRIDRDVPTYFRYLVLTCLVSATESGAGATRNFRVRLGELLGEPGGFANVSGINGLWSALRQWSERRRASGEPIRRIELPSYGNMNLIGYAVRIAFPSWDDRRALSRILETMSPDVRRTPVRLVQELSRPRYSMYLPAGVAGALHDFSEGLSAGQRMLRGHRFWRLVSSIADRLEIDAGPSTDDRWRLSVRFGGYEQDDVRLRLFRWRTQPGEAATWEGSLQEFSSIASATLPRGLATARDRGVLVLAEAPGASWCMGDVRASEAGRFVLVARAADRSLLAGVHTEWRRLEADWSASEPLRWLDVKSLISSLGMRANDDDGLEDLVIGNGIRLGPSIWLGRPGFLPTVEASRRSSISLQRIGDDPDVLTVGGCAPQWQVEALSPVSGHWRVTASEAGHETERLLCLEADVRERWEFPEQPGLDREIEISIDSEAPEVTASPAIVGGEVAGSTPMDHLLEAIYASPLRGWSEADLVSLLDPVMPARHFIWDFLRGLAEAGWLEPMLSRSWRARTWHLRAPQLFPIGSRSTLIEGALGGMARRRLDDTAAAIGGRVLVQWNDRSRWTAPIIVVENVDLPTLSSRLEWPISPRTFPHVPAAPLCWALEPRSEQGRIVAGSWDFDVGLFVSPRRVQPTSSDVRLDRLAREKMDDRDLFRVRGGGPDFVSSSRTAGILEAYRRKRMPLFAWSGDRLVRTARSGHLPLPIGRGLRRRLLVSAGPTLESDGSWSYAYPCDVDTARSLGRIFGTAIAEPERSGSPSDFIARSAMARRQGRPSTWYRSNFVPRPIR